MVDIMPLEKTLLYAGNSGECSDTFGKKAELQTISRQPGNRESSETTREEPLNG